MIIETFAQRALLTKCPHLFNTIVDIGASNGSWFEGHFSQGKYLIPESLRKYSDDFRYIAAEANPDWASGLQRYCEKDPRNRAYHIGPVGKHTGAHMRLETPMNSKVHGFVRPSDDVSDDTPRGQHELSISLDDLVKQKGGKPPYFLKLDTHGSDHDIISGSRTVIQDTFAVWMECYNFLPQGAPDVPPLADMVAMMDVLGFRLWTMFKLVYRATDCGLYEVDCVWLRPDAPVFEEAGLGDKGFVEI